VRITYHNQTLAVTISMGVASNPLHATDIDAMLKAADAALYRAKNNGRDQVIVAEATEQTNIS
jgi:diguanylate cyclase (GGDEF)-like protein